jgi:hypothetical protein
MTIPILGARCAASCSKNSSERIHWSLICTLEVEVVLLNGPQLTNPQNVAGKKWTTILRFLSRRLTTFWTCRTTCTYILASVTRRFAEKSAQFFPNIAQNGALVNANFAQRNIWSKLGILRQKVTYIYVGFLRWTLVDLEKNSVQIISAIFFIKSATNAKKYRPKWRNSAQSGHTDTCVDAMFVPM